MSIHLQRQISKLKEMILSMGTLTEEAVAKATRAIETRDPLLAKQVIDGDSEIDLMEIDVEEECLHTLALHQPVALDLRYVVAVLKINNDLERIADLAVNVAEKVTFLRQVSAPVAANFELPGMAKSVRAMLKQSLDALVNIDPELAEQVRAADDHVDLVHKEMYRVVEQNIRAEPEKVEALVNLLGVSRNLERIADHAVNIAEDVIYLAKGDILRHSRPHPLRNDAAS
ncbi:MAG: phosphate signaling complex protein PhoU [Planctomycetota bacterium]|nr:phosphate signaling complex protein PhoU [Planctomycetota bacterium]